MIHLPEQGETGFIVLFIASQIWRENGRIGERIIWISRDYLRKRGKYDLTFQNVISIEQAGDRLFEKIIGNKDKMVLLSQSLSTYANTIELSRVTAVTGLPSFP